MVKGLSGFNDSALSSDARIPALILFISAFADRPVSLYRSAIPIQNSGSFFSFVKVFSSTLKAWSCRLAEE